MRPATLPTACGSTSPAGSVLKVPTSALFRVGDAWAVFVVDGGLAKQTLVEIGRQTGQDAEVRSGLVESTPVVVHPSDMLADGARVQPRAAPSR